MIEGALLLRGTDPFDLTIRQMVGVAKAWFLSFFEPGQWQEVEDKLAAISERERAAADPAVPAGVSVSRSAMQDMRDLLAAAGGGPVEESPNSV